MNLLQAFKNKIYILFINLFPAYRRTGGKVIFLSPDWHEIKVQLKLTWKTNNLFGVIFGGSIYGSVDPVYIMQLHKILGKNYIVWDKEATIKFIKPIKTTVYSVFKISPELIEKIKNEVAVNNKYIFVLEVDYCDKDGVLYAKIFKTIYVADKKYYLAVKS